MSRSDLIQRLRGSAEPRRRHHEAQDAAAAPLVRRLVDARPAYGYRRITALVNRESKAAGEPPANHERICRLMKIHGLLLRKHSGERPGRTHDGKVAAMRSNLRRCSDGFEFPCWNGDVIRVAFALDAHDREAIAWRAAASAGISGSDIRDPMSQALETRFGAMRAPTPIEWLSDNGSPCRARDAPRFAARLNLLPRFTPTGSPESNGVSEAFVKTFKRDCLGINPLPDAATALDRIDGWFEDCNENHPHSGLKMRSPREFIRAHQPAEVSG